MRYALAVAVVLVAGGCGRGVQERAAVQAQDACIVALEPVAQGRQPTTEELGRARRHAEAAVDGDGRWRTLRDRVEAMADDPADRAAVDALAEACRAVNDDVRTRL